MPRHQPETIEHMKSSEHFTRFAAFHLAGLVTDEIRNNLIIAVINRALADESNSLRYWSFGHPGACAVQSPGWPLLMAGLDAEQCAQLAERTADQAFPAIIGPDKTTDWYMLHATNRLFGKPVKQQILSISHPPAFPGAPGRARPVTASDAPYYVEWMQNFHRETVPNDPPPDPEQLRQEAGEGSTLMWWVDDTPVSMARIGRRTTTTAAINGVYTPLEQRRKGYAGSVVATLVNQAYSEGRSTACLFVDASDPRSTRCYHKIGFRHYCDCAYVTITGEQE